MRRVGVVLALGLVMLMPLGASNHAGRTRTGAASASAPADTARAAALSDTARAAALSDTARAAALSDTAGAAALSDSASADSLRALAAPPSAAPRDYLAEVRANFTPENRAYAGIRVLLDFVEPALVILLMLVMLFSGLSARLRDVAVNLGHRRYVQALVYFAIFSVVLFIATLPLEWYRGFGLEHQYGLSNESLLDWFLDQIKTLAFSIVLFGVVPLVALAYGALEKYPRAWWMWLAAATPPLILAVTLLSPLVFEPAFNRFTPLRDESLRREIVDLARRAGIPGRKVLESNRSEQTRKYNAYVSGFGASQRIVLWDTILEGMERDEVLFVMGHEMGHYRLHHIWKGIAFTSALGVLVFFFAGQLVGRTLRRFGEQWHVRDVHDLASLPLFVIVLTVLSLAVNPAGAAYSRAIEHEADVFSLEVTRDNDAGARAFLKLGSQNRNDPAPSLLVKMLLYDHPPLAERIRFALEYRPWTKGEPNRVYREEPVRGR